MTIVIITALIIHSSVVFSRAMAMLLKPKHSLVNVSPFRLINKLRDADTATVVWAHLKPGHAVDSYSEQQLKTELEGLVGAPAVDILVVASKPSTKANLRMALNEASSLRLPLT